MEVFVNDNLVNTTPLEAGATLEESLRQVQSNFCGPDDMVIGIACDGSVVPSDEISEALKRPATSVTRLDVITGTKANLVMDAMSQASINLTETESECSKIAEQLTRGNTVEATKSLGACLRVWHQVHETMAKSIEMLQLDIDTTRVGDESLAELIVKPKEVLLQVKSALQQQDYVLLADVLNYEFGDVTSQWHEIIDYLRQEATAMNAPTV